MEATNTNNSKRKVIALYRVSTDKQDLTRQQIDLRRALAIDGYDDNEIIEIGNKESGVLLSMDEREGIATLKQHVEEGNVDAVYVHELSRLSRRTADTFAIRDYLMQHRVQLVCLNPNIKCFTEGFKIEPTANLVFSVMAGMAENEGFIRKERFRSGKAKNKLLGKSTDGKRTIPYGYMIDSNKYIIPDPDRAPIVRKIFELYATGQYSIFTLKKEMEKQGVSLRSEHINGILAQTKYYDNSPIQPLISVEIYNRCKAIRESNNTWQSKQYKHHYFGAGVLKCADCGYAFVANGMYYYCLNRAQREAREQHPCNNRATAMIKHVDSILWHVARLMELQALKARQEMNVAEVEERIKEIETRIETISSTLISQAETKKKRVVSAWVEGVFDDTEKANRLNRIAADVNTLKAEVADLNSEKAMLQAQLNGKDDVDFSGFFNSYIGLSEADEIKMQGIVKRHVKKAHIVETEKGRCLRMYMVRGDIAEVYIKGRSKVNYWVEVDGELRPLPIDTIIRTPDGMRIEKGSNTNIITDALAYDRKVFERFVA